MGLFLSPFSPRLIILLTGMRQVQQQPYLHLNFKARNYNEIFTKIRSFCDWQPFVIWMSPKAVRNLSPRTTPRDLSAAKSSFSCDDTDVGNHPAQGMGSPGAECFPFSALAFTLHIIGLTHSSYTLSRAGWKHWGWTGARELGRGIFLF